jgi:protein associated with RNAse G/E
VLDVPSFQATDSDTDHYLVVTKVKKSLVVKEQRLHRFHMERFNLKKLNEAEGEEKYCVEVSNRFQALDAEVEINSTCEMVRDNIKISAKECLGY